MRITFDGAGDGLGQEAGATGGEVVAQLEAPSAQVSHNSSRDGRGRSAVFFMLRSNGGQRFGLSVLSGTGLVHLGGCCLGAGGALGGFSALCPITPPGPASTEHGTGPQGEGGDYRVMQLQQLLDSGLQLVLDPETGQFVWDAKGNRIANVGDAVADADAMNRRAVLVLIEQIQGGGGTIGVTPKFWAFEGDGVVTDFPLAGADVLDPLFYDTAVETAAGSNVYPVSKPGIDGAFTIVAGVLGAPPAIRFNPPLGDGVRGFTTLRGYARPWIGQPPVYTVAPRIVSVSASTTVDGGSHNTLILANSASPITITIRKNTGGTVDWKEGQFFSVLQLGDGAVTLAIQDGAGQLNIPVSFQPKCRGPRSIISATCIAPDADAWVAAGDLLRIAASPDLQSFELMDRSVNIGSSLSTGTGKDSLVMPYGMLLNPVASGGIYASLSVAQATGVALTVDVKRNGTSILSTKLTFDNNERSTTTAAIPAVYEVGGNILAKGDEITIDVVQVGTALAKGLRVYLVGQRAN